MIVKEHHRRGKPLAGIDRLVRHLEAQDPERAKRWPVAEFPALWLGHHELAEFRRHQRVREMAAFFSEVLAELDRRTEAEAA